MSFENFCPNEMEILYPTLHNNDKAARIMMNCSIVSLATTQSRFDCQILTATFKPNSFQLIQVVIRTEKKEENWPFRPWRCHYCITKLTTFSELSWQLTTSGQLAKRWRRTRKHCFTLAVMGRPHSERNSNKAWATLLRALEASTIAPIELWMKMEKGNKVVQIVQHLANYIRWKKTNSARGNHRFQLRILLIEKKKIQYTAYSFARRIIRPLHLFSSTLKWSSSCLRPVMRITACFLPCLLRLFCNSCYLKHGTNKQKKKRITCSSITIWYFQNISTIHWNYLSSPFLADCDVNEKGRVF